MAYLFPFVFLLFSGAADGREPEGSLFDGIFGAAASPEGGQREFIALYRGFINEGENLENFCRDKRPVVRYADAWIEDQAVRSVLATVQFLGIGRSAGAIGRYAHFFGFDRDDFANLVDNLTGNFCSANISSMSHRKIRELMIGRFEGQRFPLPALDRAPELAGALDPSVSGEESMGNEFRLSLELFKVFCSWGGTAGDLGLLPLVLKNPVWMAFVSRRMDGRKIIWDGDGESLRFAAMSPRGLFCRGPLCRRDRTGAFHRSVGFSGVADDVDRLYCRFKETSLPSGERSDPALKAVVEGWGPNDAALMNAHLVALITGFPDLLVGPGRSLGCGRAWGPA